MKENDPKETGGWSRPLNGWLGWLAWGLLLLTISAITWLVIGFTSNEFDNAASTLRLAISLGIGLGLLILLRVLALCLCSWHNFKRALLGVGCLAGLIALFYAEEDLRGWLTWRHFKSHWEAKGEKFDFNAFIPPAIPEEQNFAMAPVVAGSYGRILDASGLRKTPQDTNVVDELQMPVEVDNGGPAKAIGNWQKASPSNLDSWQRYYRNLALSTNLFPVAEKQQSAAEDVLVALSKYDSTIEDLRKAAARPGSRFPIYRESEQPFAILLPHLAPLKGCAVTLRLRGLAELQAGHAQAALADVGLALSLTEKIRSEPFLISHLVRIAMFQISEQVIWEGLSEHRWSEAQLVALEQQLAGFDFVADYVASMRGENVCQVTTINYLRRHPNLIESLGEADQRRQIRFADLCGFLIPTGWFYQNELCSSRFILEQFVPVADVARQSFSPGSLSRADQSLTALGRTPYTGLSKMLLPALSRAAQRFAYAQASVNLARCGCALERCRLAEGKYPATLEDLAPKYISKLPADPVGGQPLHYRLVENGNFILYSVGWNERDDSGQVCFRKGGSVDLEDGDWVWRYPDIRNF